MATTEFGVNSPQSVKIWSKLLLRESIYKTFAKKFMGSGEDAIIQMLTDLEKSAGDTIKYDLLMQMSGYGVSGDAVLLGNEEAMVYRQDSVLVDQLRHGHAFRRMSQQRTLHDMRVDARKNLSDWWAARLDELLFGQLAGTFSAATSAPAGFQSHAGNTLASVTGDSAHYVNKATQAFRTDHIELLVEKAKNASPIIRPARIDGAELFALVVHPNCITDLRTSSTNNQWIEITKFANMGDVKNNPFFTGAVGMWANTVIYDSTRVPILSPGGSQYARCLFLGAQSGVIAFANAYSRYEQEEVGRENMMSWYEEKQDYGNLKGVGCGAIFGVKPCLFNSARFGMIAIDILAATHA